jgi:hypothetical protein
MYDVLMPLLQEGCERSPGALFLPTPHEQQAASAAAPAAQQAQQQQELGAQQQPQAQMAAASQPQPLPALPPRQQQAMGGPTQQPPGPCLGGCGEEQQQQQHVVQAQEVQAQHADHALVHQVAGPDGRPLPIIRTAAVGCNTAEGAPFDDLTAALKMKADPFSIFPVSIEVSVKGWRACFVYMSSRQLSAGSCRW